MHLLLEQKITKVLKEKRDLKDNTIRTHLANLNSINKLMHRSPTFRSLLFLQKPKAVIGTIMGSNFAPATKAGFLSTIISILRSLSDKEKPPSVSTYTKAFYELKRKLNKEELDQNKSEKEKDNWMTKKEINDFSKILLETKSLTDYVVWSLYTLAPPRRSADYSAMKITANPPENPVTNFLVRGKRGFKEFIFADYKNSKKKGTQTFDRQFFKDNFGRKILDILDLFLKSKKNGEYIVKKFTANTFTKYFSRLLKGISNRKLTINLMRHIYISNFLDTSPFETKKQIVADYMANSISRQALYRRKPDNHNEEKKINPNEEEKINPNGD
jgi:hypothetical protein